MAADFDGGLPSGWTATGLWHVTSACPLDDWGGTGQWASYSVDATCLTSVTGFTGVLTAPVVHLPPSGPITLAYCSAYHSTSSDWAPGISAAWVEVNGVMVDAANDPWITTDVLVATRVVDLTAFAGQTITITFHYNSASVWGLGDMGWKVDAISLSAPALDNLPPLITCNTPEVLWSPNHELVDVSSAFSVSDPDGNPVALTYRVFSDETEIPDTGDGTGRHAPDFKTTLASGSTGLFLRSERRATGNGRFYVVVITADDGNGGVTTAVCAAAVCPRDQTQESLNDALAQAAAAVVLVQADVALGTLPATPNPPPGLYEHGLSGQLGPNQ